VRLVLDVVSFCVHEFEVSRVFKSHVGDLDASKVLAI
jgi:hypothetical protein